MVRKYSSVLVLAFSLAWPLFAYGADQDQKDLLKLMPDPLPASVVPQGPPSFYSPETLYQYMDGGADIFVLYGVKAVLHEDLKVNSVDVTVDIFDMGSPDTAFGMYAAERSPDYRFSSIGAESYQDKGILNFLQDRYYIKLAGFGDGADGVLERFARALSSRIGTDMRLPALLSLLPGEKRLPHSEQFIPSDPLGHPFLGPAYAAAYAAEGQPSKLFVTIANDEADAKQRLQKLQQHFTKTGQCSPAPEFGEGAIRGANSFEGTAIAQTKGRYLVLLLNPAAGEQQILASTLDNLK